jgi:hypothetical protein
MPLRLLLLTVAIALLAAAPAQADISVTNVKAAPADTKAGGHSDFTLSFDLGGSESIKDLDVNLPAGLLGNPNNAAKCTMDQFNSDTCPAESQVGTQTVNVTVLGFLPSDAAGQVFNLVPGAGEPALLGIKLDVPGGTQHLLSHVSIRPSDSGLTSTIRDIPNTVAGLPITINSISLTLSAQSGAKKPFMTNPTSCDPATTTLHVVGDATDAPGSADGQAAFTPTACDALPYAPKISATVGEKGATAARTVFPVTTVIQQAPGEAATKSAKVTLMAPLAPNVGALANVCSVADYDADKCPDTSIVGSATAVTPLLASPLSGPVRIVDVPDNLPKLVVYLNGLINIRLTGAIQLGTEGTETTFTGIPDVPLSRFQLDFNGGANGLVGSSDDICKHVPTIKGEFTSHSGKSVTVTSTPTVKGCAAGTPGNPTPRPIAAVALRKLASSSPVLNVSAKRRAGGKKLRSVAVVLPGPLSLDRGKLSVGLKAAKGLKASLSGKRTLKLRTKSATGAAKIGALLSKGALKVSKGLKRRVGKHPKVIVKLKVTEVGGRVTTLRKSVTVR